LHEKNLSLLAELVLVSHSVENAVRTAIHDERLDDTNASDDPARELQGEGMF
jgi:hypothetical protein